MAKHNISFMADYIPHSDDALVTWLSNYKAKLALHAAALGISTADLAIHVADCNDMIAAVQVAAAKKAELANANKVKTDAKSDKLGNLRSLNKHIKTLPSYTDAIGADLNIIGSSTAFDAANAKPVLTVTLSGGKPVVAFSKEKSNGVKLYDKRSGDAVFSFLAIDTHSPYHDNRPNKTAGTPETREYYAFYIDNTDEAFGLASDVVSVMVS